MTPKHLLLATLLAAAFAPSCVLADAPMALQFEEAGSESGPQPGRGRVIIHPGETMQNMDPADFTGPLMFAHGRTVKNAPYSAEVINEQSRTLADGNQIATRTSAMSYRDSAGRTRHEVRDANGNVRLVTIRDTVAGTTLVLRPATHSATRIGAPGELARIAAEKARAAGELARVAGEKARIAGEKARAAGDKARMHADTMRAADGEQVVFKRVERSEGEDGQRVHEEVRIRVARDLADGLPNGGADRFGPMIAGAFGDMKWSSKASTRDLGTKEIDGVKAQGKLRTYDIPAGEIGNRNAIVVSTETWYAPELQVTLLSKHSDPRSGERVYRLGSLKREEPAPALFTVPSDYTVKDALAGMRKMEEKK